MRTTVVLCFLAVFVCRDGLAKDNGLGQFIGKGHSKNGIKGKGHSHNYNFPDGLTENFDDTTEYTTEPVLPSGSNGQNSGSNGCVSRDYGLGSVVCVCTANNCDTLPPVQKLKSGNFELYTSSKDGARFQQTSGKLSQKLTTQYPNNTISINRKKSYQKIHGFGGAFTDATGINILSLSNKTRDALMRSYYGEDGIQYSMGRVPIGGTDFSTRGYTYADVENDYSLKFFSLQVEDQNYKIPLIKIALNLTGNDFKLYGSAWTAPAWMKTNDKLIGVGFLNLTMYDLWAEYHVKFLDAYRENNIVFWGLTTGNEPANGFTPIMQINDMGWEPTLHAQWIAENLGPKLRSNQYYEDIKIMIIDDQRVYFPWIPRYMFQNEVAKNYVDGLAVHFYDDKYVPAELLSMAHNDFPDKFILATEGCIIQMGNARAVNLGSWENLETYVESIVDDLNNWVTGWVDWNMALNENGGPTYVGNYVDSPIIVNTTSDEFYKQPMFYGLGHFSKFVRPDSVRIQTIYTGSSLKEVALQRPDGGIVLALYNPSDNDVPVTVFDDTTKESININVVKRSINTLLYW